MTGYVETFRGVVYPWHCDHLGHMNVQHYVGMFDQAGFHFLAKLGFTFHNMQEVGETLVDVKHTVEYRREQRVGSLIVIESAALGIGSKSVTVLHRMHNSETGELAATSEVVSVYFDLRARTSKRVPDTVRERIAPFLAAETGG